MSIAIWVAVAMAVLFSMAPITNGGTSKLNEKGLAKYVRKMGLPLPDQLREPVTGRITRTEKATVRHGALGAALGIVVALLLEWLLGNDSGSGTAIMVTLLFGASLGGLAVTARGRSPLVSDAPRVARSSATTIHDYETRGASRAFGLAPITMVVGLAGAWVPWWVATSLGATGTARTMTGTGIAAGMLAPFISLTAGASLIVDRAVRASAMELTLWLGIGAFVLGLLCWAILLVPYLTGFRSNASLALWRGRDFGAEEAGRC